jgi:hypothetical protein
MAVNPANRKATYTSTSEHSEFHIEQQIPIKHICHDMPASKVAQDCQVDKVTSGNDYLVQINPVC